MSREKTSTEKRPYQAPQLKKQENLKEITLFTNFGPGSGGGSGGGRRGGRR